MSYSLNSLKGVKDLHSLKGVVGGIIYGSIIGVTQKDTRSLDYSQNVGACTCSHRVIRLRGRSASVPKRRVSCNASCNTVT